MQAYEIVEIIGPKTKKFRIEWFKNDKELKKYLDSKEAWNTGNKHYSIVAWSLKHMEAYVDFRRFGYTEG